MPMTQTPLSYYELLNISACASDAEVKAAYHRLALRYHPDRNPKERDKALERFQQINEAYSQLKTQKKRAAYNRYLKAAKIRPKRFAENDNRRPGGGLFKNLGSLFWPDHSPDNSKT